MCFDHDAHPPIEPISGAAFSSGRLVLTSEDGTEFLAYAAAAGVPGSPAVVVMPDVRGLFPFYEELADRFAERGFDAVAIDYFGRTAGLDERVEGFDFWPHVEQTTQAGITADVAVAVSHLRSGPGNENRPVFTIGFCFGGSSSWLQAVGGHGLSGVIGFYGHPTSAWEGFSSPADAATDFECPVLGLLGGADTSISPSDISAFDAALNAAGVPHELHTYEGAPHSFFDRAAAEYASASADAWERVLGFIEANRSVGAGL
ncbi:MAG: dienelactone hydrolase family protein [Acidimicrobiia bacterium]|nr:dienelactone hydrolase family protein [Acidimicrobiia bacterium]